MGIEIDVVSGAVRPITVPVTAVDTTILPGGSHLCGFSLRDAQDEIPTDGEGSITAPTAGATIASTGVMPAGEYQVAWTVSLGAGAAIADGNNFGLYSGATLIAQSVNLGAAGDYVQPTVDYQLPAAGVFTVKAIGAGTAAVVYTSSLASSPTGNVSTIFELWDGTRVVATGALDSNDEVTRSYGFEGLSIYTGLLLHIVQGAVSGSVYCRYNKAS